jgi:hypothetical protein
MRFLLLRQVDIRDTIPPLSHYNAFHGKGWLTTDTTELVQILILLNTPESQTIQRHSVMIRRQAYDAGK